MKDLREILKAGEESSATKFRAEPYGPSDNESLLRDVLALANAEVSGPRMIIVGVAANPRRVKVRSIEENAFERASDYQGLVHQYIEPPIELDFKPVEIGGKHIGVILIPDCRDRPYMMRMDFSSLLRRGDAWIRVDCEEQRVGRAQLEAMFDARFAVTEFDGLIEVGFPGDHIKKELVVQPHHLHELPSARAAANIRALIEAKTRSDTTAIVRLTHARLFGSDNPYQTQTVEQLEQEYAAVKRRYRQADNYDRFERYGTRINLVLLNHGHEPVEDVAISLTLPRSEGFKVAEGVPRHPSAKGGRGVPNLDDSSYPTVKRTRRTIVVTDNVGELLVGRLTPAFHEPLRLAVGAELAEHRLAIHYKLYGRNLRQPLRGKLWLRIAKDSSADDPSDGGQRSQVAS